jgi:hypothetical protein
MICSAVSAVFVTKTDTQASLSYGQTFVNQYTVYDLDFSGSPERRNHVFNPVISPVTRLRVITPAHHQGAYTTQQDSTTAHRAWLERGVKRATVEVNQFQFFAS